MECFVEQWKRAEQMIQYDLLSLLAKEGEMRAQDFLSNVPRKRGDYLDFYAVAGLLHAGYISSDSTVDSGGERKRGTLGLDTLNTSVFLCQLMLPQGESFQFNDCPHDSAHNFPVRIFITADGYLKLEEISEREANRRQKRVDYLISFLVAIVAAVLTAALFHYSAVQRLSPESQPNITEPPVQEGSQR